MLKKIIKNKCFIALLNVLKWSYDVDCLTIKKMLYTYFVDKKK